MAARNPQAQKRALAYVLDAMQAAGLDGVALYAKARVDPGTLRTFLDGKTYPQAKVRARMEAALGIETGSIDRAYRGMLEQSKEDPVERAIEASDLTRTNKLRLRAHYIDMLESQQERGVG